MTSVADVEPRRVQHGLDPFELSVLQAGPARDPEPVVLLHGIPTSAELWRDVMRTLARAGRRCYAPDLPGYGLTRVPPQADHSLAGAADLVAAWLRHARIGPVWLVGHDLGGGVAQILVSRYPDLVARLSLTNCVTDDSWPVTPISLTRLSAQLRLFRAAARFVPAPNPVSQRLVGSAFADPDRLTPRMAQRVFWSRKFTTAEGRAAFARHLRALDADQTRAVAGDLSSITVPTQVVWGLADPFQPWDEVGQWLAGLLPDPRVDHLEDCGHFTPLECPDGLAAALLAFADDAAG